MSCCWSSSLMNWLSRCTNLYKRRSFWQFTALEHLTQWQEEKTNNAVREVTVAAHQFRKKEKSEWKAGKLAFEVKDSGLLSPSFGLHNLLLWNPPGGDNNIIWWTDAGGPLQIQNSCWGLSINQVCIYWSVCGITLKLNTQKQTCNRTNAICTL